MQKSRFLSIAVGLFVLFAVLGLFFLAVKASRLGGFHPNQSYHIDAVFDDISGLRKDAKVAMAGVQIGRVTGVSLNAQTAEAVVHLEINKEISLPKDSSAQILTTGLLGERYIGITRGVDKETLQESDKIARTDSAVVLEKLVSAFGGGHSFNPEKFYTLTARFTDVSGLSKDAAVMQSGVPIGRITSIGLDQKTFQAIVTIAIDSRYNQIPTDSSADVLSSSLIGGKYIGITPGGDETMLGDGDEFQYTNSSVVLEKVIQQFITNMSMKK